MGNSFSTTPASGGGASDGLLRYFATLDAAKAVAALMPPLPAWAAATDSRQWNTLALCAADIDGGIRYQGRRYDLRQAMAFPRVAYEPSREANPYQGRGLDATAAPLVMNGASGGAVVWDWDDTLQMAVVPQYVLMANLFQADSLLAGKRAKRIDLLFDGMNAQAVGGGSESFDLAAARRSSGLTMALCRQAEELLERYRIRQGMIL